MAEPINMTEEKLMDSWNRKSAVDNFLADRELTVTITLAEYRSLVFDKATADMRIKTAEDGKYERQNENTELKKRIAELENIIKMISNKKEEGENDESI